MQCTGQIISMYICHILLIQLLGYHIEINACLDACLVLM